MNQEVKNRLLQLRNQIDMVDEEILLFLNRRAEFVTEVGQIKQKENISIFDPEREAELIKRLNSLNKGPLENEMLQELFQSIINTLKKLQS
jgi:chorismate mutase-like protein